eukprot:Filipodium_phascolosomae@DN1320_c0_g1_i1.p1
MGGIGSKQDPNSAPESSSKGSAEDFSERESVPKKKFETNWESFQLHNGDLLRDVDSEELNQLKSNTDPFSLEPRLGNEVLREIYPKGKKLLEEKLVESYNIQKVEGEKDVVDAFRMQIVERVYEVIENSGRPQFPFLGTRDSCLRTIDPKSGPPVSRTNRRGRISH